MKAIFNQSYKQRLAQWVSEDSFEAVLVAFVASRLLIGVLIAFSRMVVLPGPFGHHGGVFSVLVQWDAFWYLDIVRNGYSYSSTAESNMAFFPLYPLLVKLVTLLYRDVAVAGVFTSNLCLLIAGLLLYRLVDAEYKNARVARLAVTFLMFSPAGFFYSSAYPDSTYLMLAIAAFLAAQHQRWFTAGLCGMCLSATRLSGFLVLLPLLLLYSQQASLQGGSVLRRLGDRRLWSLALVPVGLLAVMSFAGARFGDYFAPFRAAAVWGPLMDSPLRTINVAHGYHKFYSWLFIAVAAVAMLSWACGIWLKVGIAYLAYAALLIVAFACSNSLEAMPRSLGLVFPLFISLGIFSHTIPWLYESMLGSSVTLLAFCTILSANGFWLS